MLVCNRLYHKYLKKSRLFQTIFKQLFVFCHIRQYFRPVVYIASHDKKNCGGCSLRDIISSPFVHIANILCIIVRILK